MVEEKKVIPVSEHWFVYEDDPISIYYLEGSTPHPVKYAKREYASKNWNEAENDALQELRAIYPEKWTERHAHAAKIRDALIELFASNNEFVELLGSMQIQQTKLEALDEESKRSAASAPQRGATATKQQARTEAHDMQREAQNDVKHINSAISVSSDEERIRLMEAMDERQIIEYFEGHLAQDYFYEFDLKGRKIVGISFAGTIQVAKVLAADHRNNGGIEVLPDIRVEDRGDSIYAFVRATDHSINFTGLGFADEAKRRYNKEKKEWEDVPHVVRIAVSKATRNVLRQLIPEKQVLELYREWKMRRG